MAVRLNSREEFASIVERFDTFLLDCDGVLWKGDTAIEGTKEVVDMLRSKGKLLIFVTNGSSKSRQDCKRKFNSMGIQVELDEIFCGSYASAIYISKVLKLSPDEKVYLLGMSGTEAELTAEGISWIGGTSADENTLEPFDLSTFKMDENVKVVLCGGDKAINYSKLSKAFQYLQAGCHFLSVNLDPKVPGKGGMHLGAGAVTFALVSAIGKDPTLIGKPGRPMWDCIAAKYSFDLNNAIIIGDTLQVDIAFGKNIGIATMMTLSGTTREKTLNAAEPPDLPDYVVNSFGDFAVLCSGDPVDAHPS